MFSCSAVNHGTKRPVNTTIKERLRALWSPAIAAEASFGNEGAPYLVSASFTKDANSRISLRTVYHCHVSAFHRRVMWDKKSPFFFPPHISTLYSLKKSWTKWEWRNCPCNYPLVYIQPRTPALFTSFNLRRHPCV